MTLTVSRYLCRSLSRYLSYKDVPRNLDLSDVFVMMSLELWTFFLFSLFLLAVPGGLGESVPPAEETWHLDH